MKRNGWRCRAGALWPRGSRENAPRGYALLYPAHMAQRNMRLYSAIFYGTGIQADPIFLALLIRSIFDQQSTPNDERK